MTLAIIFLIIALVMFLLAGFGVAARVSWRDLGFAAVVAAMLAGNVAL
jgi:hypothetical protein